MLNDFYRNAGIIPLKNVPFEPHMTLSALTDPTMMHEWDWLMKLQPSMGSAKPNSKNFGKPLFKGVLKFQRSDFWDGQKNRGHSIIRFSRKPIYIINFILFMSLNFPLNPFF